MNLGTDGGTKETVAVCLEGPTYKSKPLIRKFSFEAMGSTFKVMLLDLELIN